MRIRPLLLRNPDTDNYFSDEEIIKTTEENMRVVQKTIKHPFIFLCSFDDDFSYFLNTKTGLCFVCNHEYAPLRTEKEPYFFNADLSRYIPFSVDQCSFITDQKQLEDQVFTYNSMWGGYYCDLEFYH